MLEFNIERIDHNTFRSCAATGRNCHRAQLFLEHLREDSAYATRTVSRNRDCLVDTHQSVARHPDRGGDGNIGRIRKRYRYCGVVFNIGFGALRRNTDSETSVLVRRTRLGVIIGKVGLLASDHVGFPKNKVWRRKGHDSIACCRRSHRIRP